MPGKKSCSVICVCFIQIVKKAMSSQDKLQLSLVFYVTTNKSIIVGYTSHENSYNHWPMNKGFLARVQIHTGTNKLKCH